MFYKSVTTTTKKYKHKQTKTKTEQQKIMSDRKIPTK